MMTAGGPSWETCVVSRHSASAAEEVQLSTVGLLDAGGLEH